ncbi:hypothetical protein [Chamaesiphon sp.]|uniref:hypothetical protein n=1 Tax=Chamaesiphon sp. TaxID=2814140 RepID=UPI0035937A76
MPKIIAVLAVWIAYLGSGVAIGQEVDATVGGAGEFPPPWENPPATGRSVPKIYVSEWKKAENRDRCQPLVLLGAEWEPGVKTRRAEFSGGWAVAYDLPGERSAFGIAGTGLDLDRNGATFKFPNTITWAEGSSVSYGLQGGTGPGYLAYLKVSGQSCLYNIWSKLGKVHLEYLISSLRQVKVWSR